MGKNLCFKLATSMMWLFFGKRRNRSNKCLLGLSIMSCVWIDQSLRLLTISTEGSVIDCTDEEVGENFMLRCQWLGFIPWMISLFFVRWNHALLKKYSQYFLRSWEVFWRSQHLQHWHTTANVFQYENVKDDTIDKKKKDYSTTKFWKVYLKLIYLLETTNIMPNIMMTVR